MNLTQFIEENKIPIKRGRCKMGFCYAINPYTNRQTLCCDFCGGFKGDNKGTLSVRKIRCPFGYCQAYATCNNCKSKNTRELHIKNKCDVYEHEYQQRQIQKEHFLNNGLFLRVSAIARNETETEVTFRNIEQKERVFLMKHETYDKIPLRANATLGDYQALENITEI